MIAIGAHKGWTKSSYSVETSNCVEVCSPDSAVLVTDSKIEDTPARPVLSVSPAAFSAFVGHVRV